jgi:hypothetical protein
MRKKWDSQGNPLYRDGTLPLYGRIGIPKFVYFILAKDVRKLKIGIADNIKKRLAALQVSSPVILSVYGFVKFPNEYRARQAEQEYHKKFHSKLAHHEWFNFDEEIAEQLVDLRSDDEYDVDTLRAYGFNADLCI